MLWKVFISLPVGGLFLLSHQMTVIRLDLRMRSIIFDTQLPEVCNAVPFIFLDSDLLPQFSCSCKSIVIRRKRSGNLKVA